MHGIKDSLVQSIELVEGFRKSSRDLVREFGFLSKTIAESDLSGSAVHALIEINQIDKITAKDLAVNLVLEKSTVSRLIKALINNNYINQNRSESDAREKYFSLTDKGNKKLQQINNFAKDQVINAVSPFNKKEQRDILSGLQRYSAALKISRTQGSNNANYSKVENTNLDIHNGYCSGVLGRIIELHACFYNRLIGFGSFFETTLAQGLADFIPRLENQKNELWYVKDTTRIQASIAIDGEILGSNKALLRWFIVDSSISGQGLGKKLLAEAIQHCIDEGFTEVQLWTFSGLDAARMLYEAQGFVLTQERPGKQWGNEVLEQQFIKILA